MADRRFTDENESALLNAQGALGAITSLLSVVCDRDLGSLNAEDLSNLLRLIQREMDTAMPAEQRISTPRIVG